MSGRATTSAATGLARTDRRAARVASTRTGRAGRMATVHKATVRKAIGPIRRARKVIGPSVREMTDPEAIAHAMTARATIARGRNDPVMIGRGPTGRGMIDTEMTARAMIALATTVLATIVFAATARGRRLTGRGATTGARGASRRMWGRRPRKGPSGSMVSMRWLPRWPILRGCCAGWC